VFGGVRRSWTRQRIKRFSKDYELEYNQRRSGGG